MTKFKRNFHEILATFSEIITKDEGENEMNIPETISIVKYANALDALVGMDIGYLGNSDENVNAIVEVIRAAKALEDRVKELTEENERLKSVEFTCGFIKPHKVLECPIFDEIERAKADTVHKMQTMIKEECLAGGIYPAFVARVVERVGEKLLEESNELH